MAETLSEIVADDRIFECTGYALLAVTRKGERITVRVPITTRGMLDLVDRLVAEAPAPPRVAVTADSEDGRRLGLEENALVADYADAGYRERTRAHGREMTRRVVTAAIDAPLKRSDGTPARTHEERMAVLEAAGITGQQLTAIFNAVMALSRHAEDRADFLSASGSATAAPSPTI